jgi:acetyl-CoA carboxylase carboxyltransferase component
LEQGGAESVARRHAKGRLTIRERIVALLGNLGWVYRSVVGTKYGHSATHTIVSKLTTEITEITEDMELMFVFELSG